MGGRGGHIVNLGDIAVYQPGRTTSPTRCPKPDVVALTRVLAVALRPRRIAVNAVAPGAVLRPPGFPLARWQRDHPWPRGIGGGRGGGCRVFRDLLALHHRTGPERGRRRERVRLGRPPSAHRAQKVAQGAEAHEGILPLLGADGGRGASVVVAREQDRLVRQCP